MVGLGLACLQCVMSKHLLEYTCDRSRECNVAKSKCIIVVGDLRLAALVFKVLPLMTSRTCDTHGQGSAKVAGKVLNDSE